MMKMKLFEKLFFEGVWECYFREIQNDSVLENRIVVNNWRKIMVPRQYWCADPFIVSDGNDVYIFCELLDRKISRGLLGVGKLISGEHVKMCELSDLGCHASYPNIFKQNGKWFMIPETVDRKNIELYEAVEFPFKWEKVSILLSGVNAVDTTVFIMNGRVYLFIYEENGFNNNLSIGELDLNEFTLRNVNKVMHYNGKIGRPGGNVVYISGEMIRPTQFGVNHYGEALIFKRFQYNPQNGVYLEDDLFEVHPSDILPEYIAKKANGLHTYNRMGNYEVIDIHRKAFFIERPFVSLLKKFGIGGYQYYVRKK